MGIIWARKARRKRREKILTPSHKNNCYIWKYPQKKSWKRRRGWDKRKWRRLMWRRSLYYIMYIVYGWGLVFLRDAARCCSFRWGADDSAHSPYGRGTIVNCVSYCGKIARYVIFSWLMLASWCVMIFLLLFSFLFGVGVAFLWVKHKFST